MTFKSPPQCGQWVKSRLNTRFNSLAQPKRSGRPCSGGAWVALGCRLPLSSMT
jgi:hypothetical protein